MKYPQPLVRSANRFLLGFARVLPSSRLIYHFCRYYISRYNGENDPGINHNGEKHWLESILGECRIVFDVGANIGDWTEIALSINPQLQVHCFEPSAATFQQLQGRPFMNGRVILNNIGLSSSAGEMDLFVFPDGGSWNSLYRRQGLSGEQSQVEKIRIDTLDAYCAKAGVKQIDLLKIDVEGNELKVLQGAGEMLAQGAIHYVQFEYGGTYIDARILLKDMFELFHSYGYQLHKIYPTGLRYVGQYDQQLENFQYQNWVAIKQPK